MPSSKSSNGKHGNTSNKWQNRIVGYGAESPDQLLANPFNFRIHSHQQQDSFLGVVHEVGVVQNVIVNRTTQHVIDGHMRIALALREEQPEIPITYVELTEDEERLVLASYDAISAMAAIDAAQLDDLLQAVNSDQPAVQEMLAKLAEDAGLYGDGLNGAEDPGAQIDRAAELQEIWQVKRGDLWIIPSKSGKGEHRLLCGDSTNADDVARVMGGERAALLATDPPYNVGIDYGEDVDDDKISADYETFSCSWFGAWREVSERQITTPGYNNQASWFSMFGKPYHVGAWTKTNSMTRGHVSRFACYEPIFFHSKQWKRERANDVFDFPVSAQRTESGESLTTQHPCPKPLGMWVDLIENYTVRGDIVADAFSGSGTTIVACEQLGRQCRAIEIEPKYCAVTLQRLTDMGLTPELQA